MDLLTLLEQDRAAIVAAAAERLASSRLPPYDSSPPEENRARLDRLTDLVVESVRTRNLIPMVEFAQGLAERRFHAGFDLAQVQVAFNALEEAIWRHITERIAPEDYPQAFGLIGTVLGAGKEALAVRYVSLAAQRHVPTLDLSALFKGS